MKIEEHFNLLQLFDIYGGLLSDKQQRVMDQFLNLDIGESEIAESFGETRQSIHDAISKAKKQLNLFDEKCRILESRMLLESKLNEVKSFLLANNTEKSIEKIDEILRIF